MGAPPTVMPGEPKVLLLCPVVVVPPIGVEEPKVLAVPESVPPVVEVEVPVLPNGEDPVLPEGEELKGELLLVEEDPNDELPNEELPNDDPEDDPNGEELVEPLVVFVEAPVGVMPLVFCIDWPNKPIGPTLASPR
jgi:hypothetical protein